jgi:hypothetical protein
MVKLTRQMAGQSPGRKEKGMKVNKTGEVKKIMKIREELNMACENVKSNLEHSRERSLVLTKLEEADLWLLKCIINSEP